MLSSILAMLVFFAFHPVANHVLSLFFLFLLLGSLFLSPFTLARMFLSKLFPLLFLLYFAHVQRIDHGVDFFDNKSVVFLQKCLEGVDFGVLFGVGVVFSFLEFQPFANKYFCFFIGFYVYFSVQNFPSVQNPQRLQQTVDALEFAATETLGDVAFVFGPFVVGQGST